MKNVTLALATLASLVAAVAPAAGQQQIGPPPPMLISSPIVTINNTSLDQTDPHVSGDLVSYTDDRFGIRYFRFSTGEDSVIPSEGVFGDILSDVSGNRIAFTRQNFLQNAIIVFDTSTSTLTEIDAHAGSNRVGSAIGGDTLAFIDFGTLGFLGGSSTSGVVFVFDLSNPSSGSVQLSSGTGASRNPAVSPDGNTVLWEQCSSLQTCDVMKSTRSGGTWSAATLVANSSANADSDGTWIVYDSNRAGSLTGRDVYFRPVGGGTEWQLVMGGDQTNPSISQGVIAFEQRTQGAPGSPGLIFVYVIGANELYLVPPTPTTIDQQLSDVSVLPNGDIRVVWAENDGSFGGYNIYATTFTPTCVTNCTVFTDRATFVQAAGSVTNVNFDQTACGVPIDASTDAVRAADLYANVGVTFLLGKIAQTTLATSPPNALFSVDISLPPVLIEPLIYGTFAQPVHAVGFTNANPSSVIGSHDTGTAAKLTLFDVHRDVIDTATTDAEPSSNFLGIVSTQPIASFTIAGPKGVVVDDLIFTEIATPQCASPLTVSAPGNITIHTSELGGAASGVVSFAATFSDGVPPVSLTCTPPSGSTFFVGPPTTVTCTATDATGANASASFMVMVIDDTPPAISVPGPIVVDATSPNGAAVTFSVAATDNVAVASVNCYPASGSQFPITTTVPTTVTCTATDTSGNTSTAQFTVTVVGAPGQLIDLVALVQQVTMLPGMTTSLQSKLQNALAAAQAGDVATACSLVASFINEVNAQTQPPANKKLTPAQASVLIAAANQIKSTLGCP